MGRDALGLTVIAIGYFACLELAFLFPVSRQLLGTVWPAAGVALASLLLSRRERWGAIVLVLFAVGLAANLLVGRSFALSAGYVVSDLLESTLCAMVIQRLCGPNVSLLRIKEVLALILAATAVNAFSALAGAATASLASGAKFWPFWTTWWVGDGLGILLVTPAIVAWSGVGRDWRKLSVRHVAEFGLFILIWYLIAYWILIRPKTIGPVFRYGYLLMALMAWGALRLGQRTVSFSLIAAGCIAMTGAWMRTGHNIPFDQLVQLQLLLGTMAVTGLLLTASLHESREDQERLRASEEKYRDIFENAAGALFVSTVQQGHYVKVNNAAARMFGFASPEEMIRRVNDIEHQMYVNPADRKRFLDLLEANDQITGFEAPLKRSDGTTVWVSMNARIIRDEQGRPMWMEGMSTDITERRRLEGLHRLQSEITTHIAEGISLVNAEELTIVFANPKMEAMLGYGPGELAGKPVSVMNAPSAGGDPLETARKIREQVQACGSWKGEVLCQRKDGSTFWSLISVSSLIHHPEYGPVHVSVHTDISGQKRAQEERERLLLAEQDARKLAESASAAKDRFIATLSHELRTPLTPALLALSGWRRKAELDPDLRADIEMVLRNLQAECQLIDDLLDTTRIARGKLVLNYAECDLAELARRCVLMFAAAPGAARIDLELPESGPVAIEADAVRVKQVIWNLLSNARKFTPANGRIVLRVGMEEQGGFVWLSVIDSGCGIGRADQPRLFEPFKQVVSDGNRRPHGLGLGLSICRGIAQAHGGEVACFSDGPGKGAQFTLRVPVRRAEPQLPGSDHISSSAPALNAVATNAPVVVPCSILLVEDHDDTSLTLTRILTAAGHRVRTAGTLGEARDELSIGTPDVMICDISLPDGDAYELLAELRTAGRHIPSIAISGFGSPDDLRQSMEAGFIQHLTKPVAVQVILDVVQSVQRPQRAATMP